MLKKFVLTLIFSSALSYNIPSYVHLCRRNDPELDKCFVNTINELRPYLRKGIPEMNLESIDPYHIESIKLRSGNYANNGLEMEMSDGILENFSYCNITRFSIDLNKGLFTTQLIIKDLKLTSKYNVKGKLLVFNLDTDGDFKLEVGELITNVEWHASTYKKEDKDYFNISSSNVTTDVSRASIQLENVFKDKALNDNFNSVINKNIDILLPEFMPIIHDTINVLSMKYLNSVYSVFPLDVLFPND